MPNIVFFGGTKFFGLLLVEKLVAAGYHVTVVSRINVLPTSLEGSVEHICEDVNLANRLSITKQLETKKIDIVIDTISWQSGDVSGLIKMIIASGNLLQQYILCSSGAVDIHEPADNNFIKGYIAGKRSAEQELIESSKRYGFSYTIMRPVVIEGEHDPHLRTWYWVQRLLDGGPIFIPSPETKTLYKHVYVSDVAEVFFKAVGNKQAFNEIFSLAGEDVLTVEEYIYALAEALNISHNIKLVGIQSFEFPPFFSGVSLLPDITKAKEKLQYEPTPTKQWLQGLAGWLVENKANLPDSLGYEKRKAEIDLIKSRLIHL